MNNEGLQSLPFVARHAQHVLLPLLDARALLALGCSCRALKDTTFNTSTELWEKAARLAPIDPAQGCSAAHFAGVKRGCNPERVRSCQRHSRLLSMPAKRCC